MKLLIADDDVQLRNSLEQILIQSGFTVETVGTGKDVVGKARDFDIILLDYKLPDISGIDVLKEIAPREWQPCVIVMTAFGTHDLAVQSLRSGAYDYINKPFSAEELLLTIRKLNEREKLRAQNKKLKAALSERYGFSSIISKSNEMEKIFTTVKQLSDFSTTVLITGESGTGKELLARAIHEHSPRRGKNFIAINCGAIPENLIESELFGHKKGAFTDAVRDKKGLFEEASGGTIFLDEIGELPLHLQVKLLRSLQEQEIVRVGDTEPIPIDVRIISATLRDLEADVSAGRFRDDLFYRLNVVSIHLPSLKDRPEDIPLLTQHFIEKISKRLGISKKKLSVEVMKIFHAYPWRGNIRELENCIERLLVLSDKEEIGPELLPNQIRNFIPDESKGAETNVIDLSNLSIKEHSRELEIKLIKQALKNTKGNRTHAAKILEISHRALLYKLKEYGLGAEE